MLFLLSSYRIDEAPAKRIYFIFCKFVAYWILCANFSIQKDRLQNTVQQQSCCDASQTWNCCKLNHRWHVEFRGRRKISFYQCSSQRAQWIKWALAKVASHADLAQQAPHNQVLKYQTQLFQIYFKSHFIISYILDEAWNVLEILINQNKPWAANHVQVATHNI